MCGSCTILRLGGMILRIFVWSLDLGLSLTHSGKNDRLGIGMLWAVVLLTRFGGGALRVGRADVWGLNLCQFFKAFRKK